MKVLLVENKNLSVFAKILGNNFQADVSKALDICQAEDFLQENEYGLILVFEPQLIGLSDSEIQQLRQEFGAIAYYWYGGIALIKRILKRNPDLASKIIFVSYDISFFDNQDRLEKEMPLVKMFSCRKDYFEEIERRLKK